MIRYFFFIASVYMGALWSLTPEQIDHFVEETLQKWEIPGLALAVIQKGEEIQVKGYGVRERGSNKFVDTQTLFQINSLTKAFTTLTVDLLVKEGKIDWDLPIHFYFPDFQSKDPDVTQQLSLRDLLCHRSGLPGNLYEGWRLFRNTQRTCKELMQRLAFIDLTFPFRSRFNYDNMGYAIAAEVVANTLGISWADFCHQKIFDPLRMNRTCLSYSTFLSDENSALPHVYQVTQPICGYNWEKDSLEAASGINSCAQDMALWLDYCLTHRSDFAEAHKPHITINAEDLLPETELPTFAIIAHGQSQLDYGMGWWIYHLEDKIVYRHTGSSSGMQSVLAIVPDEELGIVILSNQSKHPAVSALMNQLLDGLLNRSKIDWQQQGLEAFFEVKENQNKWLENCQLNRNQDIPPSLTLSEYVGTYTHLGYGSILIEKSTLGLDIALLFCNEKGDLRHWEGNQFEIQNTPSGSLRPFLCEFLFSAEGSIIGLKIDDMGVFERIEIGLTPPDGH